MSGAPAISLPLFDGPLDLLLELVRKNQVEITEIPIAEITRQYLAYMNEAAQLDIDLGAEFTYLAATLIQLKSRSLLPTDPELTCREPDAGQELIRQLLDHAQVQQAAEFLQQQLEVAGSSWSKTGQAGFPDDADEAAEASGDGGSMNLLDLVRLAKQALEAARSHAVLEFQPEEVSVGEMIGWLEPRLARLETSLPLDVYLDEQPDQPRRIALFLAVLELSKAGSLRLEQKEAFAPIQLSRTG